MGYFEQLELSGWFGNESAWLLWSSMVVILLSGFFITHWLRWRVGMWNTIFADVLLLILLVAVLLLSSS